MKKIVFLMFIIFLIVIMSTKNNQILIPNEAIRIRVIPNSNDLNDQKLKSDIKNEVSNYLYNKISNVDNYEDANKIIAVNLNNINAIVGKHTDDFNIYYGSNYFPKKNYKGVNYGEGKYKSLVIKLGEAKGDNFWCVLFPPLCSIDEKKFDGAKYKLYVSKLLNKIK